MEIKVLEKKKTRLVFELKGADHTLCNAVKDELWNDPKVEAAGYNIDHPLTGVPKFVVETASGTDPKDALDAAIKRLKKLNDKFATDAKKEFAA